MSASRGWCSFRIAGTLFGVPVESVVGIVRRTEVTPVPGAGSALTGLMHLRGRVVPVVDLRAVLGGAPIDRDATHVHVIVRDGDDEVSLIADRIGDFVSRQGAELDPTPETLGTPYTDLVTHVVRMPDDLLLALDTALVLNHAFPESARH